MIRTRKSLVLAVASVAVVVLAGAVLAGSGSNNRPPSGSHQGVTGRVTQPRNPVVSGKFKYNNIKTGWYTLSPSDFSPDHVIDDYFTDWSEDELNSTDSSACFNAGVHVPQGAKITWVDFYYRSGPNTNLYGEFFRQDIAANTAESLALVTPLEDTGLPTASSAPIAPGLQKVKNHQYAYMIGACPVDDTYFHGARVEYTYRSAGD